MSRYVVILKNKRGVPIATCDFDDAESAEAYFEQAKIAAKQIGGRAEMEPEAKKETKR